MDAPKSKFGSTFKFEPPSLTHLLSARSPRNRVNRSSGDDNADMEAKDKAQEAMRMYTSGCEHDVLSSEAIAQQLVQHRQNEGQHQPLLLLVDVRSDEEMAVSMIPGSMTRKEFEKRQELHHDDWLSTNVTVVPYCTVGYRSGRYCDQLVQRGFPPHRVKNGEGIVLWTHLPGATLLR